MSARKHNGTRDLVLYNSLILLQGSKLLLFAMVWTVSTVNSEISEDLGVLQSEDKPTLAKLLMTSYCWQFLLLLVGFFPSSDGMTDSNKWST
jgi:hypothetical protein